jgi:type IV pilus assembly protein PilX
MSLVILLILTILGVTALSTSSLQEKMAGNIQDVTRAFQAAESGTSQALATAPLVPYSIPTSLGGALNYGSSGQMGTANVTVAFIDVTDPKPSNDPGIFSKTGASGFKVAHFDLISTGTTTTNAREVVHQGVGLIVPGN